MALLLAAVLATACSRQPEHLTTEVLLPFTPVKNQGTSQTCWAYAMLSAIETEHICRGDSIHLSVAFIARAVEKEAGAPSTKRGMGITTVNMMMKHGIVPFDVSPLVVELGEEGGTFDISGDTECAVVVAGGAIKLDGSAHVAFTNGAPDGLSLFP